MEDKNIMAIIAMILIAILEICAMFKGIDGYGFGVVVAVISGLAGYKIKSVLEK